MKLALTLLTFVTIPLFGSDLAVEALPDNQVADCPVTPPLQEFNPVSNLTFKEMRQEFADIAEIVAQLEQLALTNAIDLIRDVPAEVEAVEAIDLTYGALHDLAFQFSQEDKTELTRKKNRLENRISMATSKMIDKLLRNSLLLAATVNETENIPPFHLQQLANRLDRLIQLFNSINNIQHILSQDQITALSAVRPVLAALDQQL